MGGDHVAQRFVIVAVLAALANGGCATVMMAALGGAACQGDGQCARSALEAGMAVDGAMLTAAAQGATRSSRVSRSAVHRSAGKREDVRGADYVCHDAAGAAASFYDAPSRVVARTVCLEQHGLSGADPASLDRGCRCRRVRLTDFVSPPVSPTPVVVAEPAPAGASSPGPGAPSVRGADTSTLGAGRALEPPTPPIYTAEEEAGRLFECVDGRGRASIYVTAWTPGEARASCGVLRGIAAANGAAILVQCQCRSAR